MIDSTENRMTPIDGWIWISWEAHRRTESMCHELGIPLFVNTVSLPGLLRYMKLSLWTVSVVARIRPRGVVTQNPSIVLTLLATLLRPIFRFYLVVDAHNEAADRIGGLVKPAGPVLHEEGVAPDARLPRSAEGDRPLHH